MKLERWLISIGMLVAVGMLQVAERNTVYLKGYALGDRVVKNHKEPTDVSWLEARVLRLASPEHLSDAAQERHLNLVAWSMLTAPQAQLLAGAPRSNEAVQITDGRDTTD